MSQDTLYESDEKDGFNVVEDEPKGEHVNVDDEPDSRQYAQDDDKNDDDDRRASIRERRRLEKIERKERQEEARKRRTTEMAFLEKRNEELERRFSALESKQIQSELSEFDTHIAQAKQRAQLAEQVFAKAINAKNGEDAAKAMQYRDQARAAVYELEQRKNQELYRINQAQQSKQAEQNMPPARQVEMAQEFIQDHDWYDPSGADEDSAIVLAIDAALVRSGLDPNSEEYWDELRERVQKRLPDRFDKKQDSEFDKKQDSERKDTNRPRGGPQIGSGRSTSSPSGRREVYISPERKQAMIEANVWDDPILRKKYIARYMEYDKQNSR